jgi:hypothetical protein
MNETVRVELSNDQSAKLAEMRQESMNKYRVQARKLDSSSERPIMAAPEPEQTSQDTVMVVLPEAQRQALAQAGDYLNQTAELEVLSDSFKGEDIPEEAKGTRRIERDLMLAVILVILAVATYFLVFQERPVKEVDTGPTYQTF